jgi:hypothetical protein
MILLKCEDRIAEIIIKQLKKETNYKFKFNNLKISLSNNTVCVNTQLGELSMRLDLLLNRVNNPVEKEELQNWYNLVSI